MTQPIPDKALAQHIAVLGKTGSGKSYAIRGVVERLLDDEARCCVIDPTGTWWGLKSSATGKSGGYPVVIFGGTHADLPLGAAHGEALAEAIGTSSTPAILDYTLGSDLRQAAMSVTRLAHRAWRDQSGRLARIEDWICPCGGSLSMVTGTAPRSMSATIQREGSGRRGTAIRSSAPAKSSCCAPSQATPSSAGESSSTTVDSGESTAPSSATSRRTAARALFAKRIRSLIAGGLIAGITPMSIRKRSAQRTLAFASSLQDGADAE
jgi:hypothetical protein